jgi:hypothetical protein
MADWTSLCGYIRNRYKITEDKIDMITLIFDTGSGRSQRVLVSDAGNNWAQISTAVCEEQQVSARDALVRNSQMRIGGLALVDGGPVIFRHSFPLATLDVEEFEEPLEMVVKYGDQLARELAGGADRF